MRTNTQSNLSVAAAILMLGLLGCHSANEPQEPVKKLVSSETPARRDASRLMQRFESGDFFGQPPEEFGKQSGWEMTNEKGARFIRSALDHQAAQVVSIGREAVPELVRWLDHEEMQIRYIAHKALELITKLQPTFPHFATLAELKAKGWLEESRRTWMSWYERY